MGMDAAGRDEPEQVHVAAALLRAVEGTVERRKVEERTALDRARDPHEVLEQDPPGTRS